MLGVENCWQGSQKEPATQGHPPVVGSCLEGSGEVFHPHSSAPREILSLLTVTTPHPRKCYD